MAKPKLCLIPAAQGSKLFSVLPSSGVGDFDFTRSGSATRINSQGLIEEVSNGVSRLNYPMIDGKVVGCPHHILEPQRTNLVTYSEDFSDSYWIKTNTAIQLNSSISPDGTNNASKITRTESANNIRFIASISGNYTFSTFLKADTKNWVRLYINYSSGTDGETYIDLENGIIGNEVGTDNKIEDFGNGWFKVSVTFNTPSTLSDIRIIIADNNGVTSGSDGSVYIYGAQLEQGSYPTSYIPTNGAAVTRAAETCNGSGDASTFNDSEGVLMAEVSALANDGTIRTFSLSSGSSSNSVRFYFGSNNSINYNVKVGGANQFTETHTLNNQQDFNKFVVKYKLNDFSLWVNGFEVGIISSGNTPIGLSEIAFDSGDGASDFYSSIKQIQYFQTALTDSELEELTSWDSFKVMAIAQLYNTE